MSPVHRDADGVHVVPSWQSVIDEKIAAARERGDFDDLPGAGQPLQIEENPLAGDWEMAFHLLENADMAPPWMEMSREIRAGMAALAEIRERTGRYLSDRAHQSETPPALPENAPLPSRFRWWPFRRARAEPPGAASRRPELPAVEAERRRARRQYLERAAQVDEVIAAYNGWLPDNLRRLQKPRLTPARAAREFDAACPPIERVMERG